MRRMVSWMHGPTFIIILMPGRQWDIMIAGKNIRCRVMKTDWKKLVGKVYFYSQEFNVTKGKYNLCIYSSNPATAFGAHYPLHFTQFLVFLDAACINSSELILNPHPTDDAVNIP